MAQTFLFPYADFSGTFSYEPGKISQLFRDFYDRTERFFRSLCTYGNGSTALRFYICAFSGSCYGGSVTISMLLLLRICCPLIEEFIFRGAVLKTLEPFGKWFALLASSLAFALMHGNFAQIPFAMAAGLILGYIAMEYFSIWYSLLLHISNNLILGDVLARYCRHNAWQQRKYPVQCDHQSARHP